MHSHDRDSTAGVQVTCLDESCSDNVDKKCTANKIQVTGNGCLSWNEEDTEIL